MKFYQMSSGEIVVKQCNTDIFTLTEKNRDFIVPIKTLLLSDYALVCRGWQYMNLESRRANSNYYDFLNVRQFFKCNFN